jgi:hypothetical protein
MKLLDFLRRKDITVHPEADSSLSYFNTTNEAKEIVRNRNSKNKKQEEIILEYMAKYPDKEMTTLDLVFNGVLKESVPETSYRRSICLLAKKGCIERVGWKQGNFGVRIGVYKFVKNL